MKKVLIFTGDARVLDAILQENRFRIRRGQVTGSLSDVVEETVGVADTKDVEVADTKESENTDTKESEVGDAKEAEVADKKTTKKTK